MIRLKLKAIAVDDQGNEQEVDLWLDPEYQYLQTDGRISLLLPAEVGGTTLKPTPPFNGAK